MDYSYVDILHKQNEPYPTQFNNLYTSVAKKINNNKINSKL